MPKKWWKEQQEKQKQEPEPLPLEPPHTPAPFQRPDFDFEDARIGSAGNVEAKTRDEVVPMHGQAIGQVPSALRGQPGSVRMPDGSIELHPKR
jgi:hypothetical protein